MKLLYLLDSKPIRHIARLNPAHNTDRNGSRSVAAYAVFRLFQRYKLWIPEM